MIKLKDKTSKKFINAYPSPVVSYKTVLKHFRTPLDTKIYAHRRETIGIRCVKPKK